MLLEVCTQSYTQVKEAILRGAHRIELCDHLEAGGTTCSYGNMKLSAQYCKSKQIPLMVVIRPRSGSFLYTGQEAEVMKEDILQAKELGVTGLVVGALTKEGSVDEAVLTAVLAKAKGLELTFPMAFDQIAEEDQKEAIDALVKLGYKRIKTHGGLGESDIEDHYGTIKNTMKLAKGKILVMPAGGITQRNLQEVAKALGAKEIHGSQLLGNLERKRG